MTRKRNKKYWNAWGEMVKASIARNTIEIPTLLSLTDFEGKKVLDAGAGVGRISEKLSGFASSIYALDENSWALKSLKEKAKNNKKFFPIKGNLENLPFKSNSFDIVLSCWTLHNLKENRKKVLSELKRVAKKNGCSIVCFSSEKYSIPKLEALTKEKEIFLRKKFRQEVEKFFKKNFKEAFVKKAKLPFYFKTHKFAFKVLSETFLPNPLSIEQKTKCLKFLKACSTKKGCFLEEEVVFVYGFK